MLHVGLDLSRKRVDVCLERRDKPAWRQQCPRIHPLGLGVALMIVVVVIDQGGASCEAVAVERSERPSRSGACNGAGTPRPSRARSGGHDGRLVAG